MHSIRVKLILSSVLLAGWLLGAHAEVDPNFYIYLCFGQSNMEGNAQPETVDKQNVDDRFLMLATCNFSSPKRNLGEWYKATPPIVSPWGGLGMADYFGRTMVAALPKDVRVGVVDVAIGGIAIEGFMPDKIAGILAKADGWQAERIRAYGSDPYQRLVDMGKKAQEVGVIKGILLHQGCSNNGDPNWPNNVKKIYNNRSVVKVEITGYNVLKTLVEEFLQATMEPNTNYSRKLLQLIPEQYKTDNNTCYEKCRSTLDFISGMTDLYAMDLYKLIRGDNALVI